MRKSSVLLSLLLTLIMASTVVPYGSAQNGASLLWSNPMSVNDVAVSKDGNYIVAVNFTGIYYFASDDPNPRWWYLADVDEYFKSVAISGDGSYVVVGDNEDFGYIYYFADADEKNGLVTEPTWKSVNLYGSVIRGTLDISDDGEYVVARGLGEGNPTVYYFAGCTERPGSPGEVPSWSDELSAGYEIYAIDMSSDGRYVAIGGPRPTSGYVMFYEDANTEPYPTSSLWESHTEIDGEIFDVAVSDDGYAVAAVKPTSASATLYYWADATTLFCDPPATWKRDWPFDCVDMSSDGNKVVAGTTPVAPCGIHFWENARWLEGEDVPETWTSHEGEEVLDVAISDDGSTIAATTRIGDFSEYWAYFLTSDGNLIGEFELESPGEVVSMSGDGGLVAVGGGLFDSLYVFRVWLPVGGELVSTPILNTMVLLMLVAIIPAVAICLKLMKK